MLRIKSISFADDEPYNSYLDYAPYDVRSDASHLTFVLNVDDEGFGCDFWGQAVTSTVHIGVPDALGQLLVSVLDHAVILEALDTLLRRHDSWMSLGRELVFEDGD